MRPVLLVQGLDDAQRSRHAPRLSAACGATLITFAGARDDAEEVIARALESDRALVVDVPAAVEPMHLVALAADAALEAATIEAVVDAPTLLELVGLGRARPCSCPRARRLIEQLEQSTMITIVRWQPLPTPTLSLLMALVSHLSPRARMRLDRGKVESITLGTIEREHDRAGWTAVLNGDHDPHMTDARMSAMRFEHLRPFHPERLRAALDELASGRLGVLVRSAGFLALSSRPGRAALWDQVAGSIDIEPLPDPEPGDAPIALGQGLALIGVDLDADGIERLLAAATLTDDELTAGSGAWIAYADPFPEWQAHAH